MIDFITPDDSVNDIITDSNDASQDDIQDEQPSPIAENLSTNPSPVVEVWRDDSPTNVPRPVFWVVVAIGTERIELCNEQEPYYTEDIAFETAMKVAKLRKLPWRNEVLVIEE